MIKEDGLPLGLGFGLAMNEEAMKGFASLDEKERKAGDRCGQGGLPPRRKCNPL